ncbi:MAG: lysophospholipid acyltransferase family protein [Pseudomonadota bacterium]
MALGPRLLRWIRHNRLPRRVVGWLGARYIRFTLWSMRWQEQGREHLEAIVATGQGFVAVLWHGRLFVSPAMRPPGYEAVAMISNNRDGDLIADIVGDWGITTVRGSSYDRAKGRDKGGADAYLGAIRAIEDAKVLAITPDGPRGPRMRAQAGAAQIAARTGCPVIAFGFSASRGVVMGSWDRFFVPSPFSRGVLYWSEAILPPAGAEDPVEAHRQAIEAALIRVTQAADRAAGRVPVEPAPPKAAGPTPAAA